MKSDASIDQDRRRIEASIAALDALDDVRARDQAKQLLQLVLELHGAGLARMMEIVGAGGAAGRSCIEAMALDPQTSALLLLHGLHPHGLEARVGQALDKLRPELGARGIRIDLVSLAQEEVTLALAGGSNGKAIRMAELREEIEHTLLSLAPDLAALHIDGLPDGDERTVEVAFVPVTSIGRRGATAQS